MRLFALKASEELGASIAGALDCALDPHEERDFEDGEHKARPLVSVRGEDVYVVHSLNGTPAASANDKLCKLLFFIAACKENGAASVTAIAPYLAYARKDRQTKARDPVTTKYVAQLFEAAGADCVMVLQAHNLAAFQNAYRCRTLHLDTRKLFTPIIKELVAGQPVAVVSPDGGGMKRAQLLKETYEAETGESAGFGFMEKRRSRGVVSGTLFAGEVKDASVFIFDDMIGSGGTMVRAARACREHGASRVYALAAHGLFGEGSEDLFASDAIDGVLVTDSVRTAVEAKVRTEKLRIVPVGPLIANAIRCLRGNGSLSDLLGMED
ncbi:ribose-phosphate diphosphokinase [Dichotomicrobium thermohalophilum]|uniref:Ribose-phosphate pyrophosphokinase n=1 Tax=Dichotomicrobium thermohalophilum TaxID=933063 RepID=A0A397Q5K6_9HYPH|nr:ribose-phosphate diphosphokinase [Dichotomicrobium thermohalophilum]RIA55729.1 ribose-phosphate pyrophosphokinase [Dichotomicrobium thermohalophilum]